MEDNDIFFLKLSIDDMMTELCRNNEYFKRIRHV